MNELVVMEGVKKGTGTEAGSKSGTGGGGAKRGRKPKDEKREFKVNGDQRKFIIDVSGDEDTKQMIVDLLTKCNSKSFGKEITFRELVTYSFSKLTDKDIPKLQEFSLTPKEKADRVVYEYNLKHGTNLSLEEFILVRDGKL